MCVPVHVCKWLCLGGKKMTLVGIISVCVCVSNLRGGCKLLRRMGQKFVRAFVEVWPHQKKNPRPPTRKQLPSKFVRRLAFCLCLACQIIRL